MPLASSRTSTGSKAAADRRRMSLPSTIDSSTKVTTRSQRAIDRRRTSLQRQNSNNKRMLEPSSPTRKEQASAVAVDKENTVVASPGVTPYWKVAKERGDSPRLTRSATKKKDNKRPKLLPAAPPSITTKHGHEDYGPHGVLLNFSPPDHLANAQREQEERERKLQARERRIQEAKERGRLLVFSPCNNGMTELRSFSTPPRSPSPRPPLVMAELRSISTPPRSPRPCRQSNHHHHAENHTSSPSGSAVSTMSSQSQTVAATSSTVEASLHQHHEQVENELRSLRQGVDQLLATQEQAKAAVAAAVEDERRRADQMELEAQMVRSESLASANRQLEETNNTLQQRVNDLQRDMDQAKELLTVERTRLEVEVKATQRESAVRIQGLEESRQQLETQVATLQQHKTTMARQVSDLETEVKVAREKLDHAKSMLESVRSSGSLEKETLQQDLQRLNEVNVQLTTNLRSAIDEQQALLSKLNEHEGDLYRLQHELLPESEEQLQETLAKLQEQTQATLQAESQLQRYQAKVKQLQQEVTTLRDGMQHERINFQKLNEDSTLAFEKLKKQAAMKDEQLKQLVERVKTLENDLEQERKSSQQCKEEFSRWKHQMEHRASELDQALAETMSQLEEVEGKEKDATYKLEQTLSRLDEETKAKEQAMVECQHHEAVVSQLEEACHRLEAEAREQRHHSKEVERQLAEAKAERDFARDRAEHRDTREEELFRKLMDTERLRRDLHNRVMQLSGNIRVFVRVRPPLTSELDTQRQEKSGVVPKDRRFGSATKRKKSVAAVPPSSDEEDVILFRFPGIYDRDETASVVPSVNCHGTDDITKNLIEVSEPYKDRGGLSDRRKTWKFGFDQVFTPQQNQEDVWNSTEPLVQSAIDGYNVTIFAFGQTGSGKTYTLLGEPGNEGLIARSIAKLFEAKRDIAEISRGETAVEMSVELLEIYNEQVRDLLAPNSGPNGSEIALKITSNEAIGNEQLDVASEEEVAEILGMAQKRRCVKATLSNAESSRSHLLFTIHFHVKTKDGIKRYGKLNICDLAGSERLAKSGANAFVGGELLKETQHINQSLSTLSNVIERLQAGSTIVPFRESKLTFLLQNSLGGNSKTLAIVCCNPLASHFHESLCSLRFASKVSKVDLKAVANFSC